MAINMKADTSTILIKYAKTNSNHNITLNSNVSKFRYQSVNPM